MERERNSRTVGADRVELLERLVVAEPVDGDERCAHLSRGRLGQVEEHLARALVAECGRCESRECRSGVDEPAASNGPVEAANLLIKQVKRAGRGFRNVANYRLRILLAGGLMATLNRSRGFELVPAQPRRAPYVRRRRLGLWPAVNCSAVVTWSGSST